MYSCEYLGAGGSWLGMALWWGVLVLGIVWLLQALGVASQRGRRGPTAPGNGREMDAALRLLRERYARGEIDTDEFDRRRAGLV